MQQSPKDRTPLHFAAQTNALDAATLLVSRGADVNVTDRFGNSLLGTAVDFASEGMVRLLLQHGVHVTEDDVNAAAWSGREPVVALLSEYGVGLDNALHTAARRGPAEVVRLLLERGANPNAKHWSNTPLHFALTAEIAEVLIQHGADVHARDAWGRTPLHFAAEWPNNDLVLVLLEHGAEVNAKDHEGQTPLHVAAAKGRASVADLLIRHGAEVNARDNQGRTPLSMADDEGIRNLLKARGAVE